MTIFSTDKLSKWCNGVWKNIPPENVNGVSHDSRSIKPGNMFIALKGPNFDGHDYIDEVIKKGASCALVSSASDFNCPTLQVIDTHQALIDIAKGHRSEISADIITITGSVGKTSVKEMLADVLATVGKTTRTINNWNNNIGLPLSMLEMENKDKYGVFEIGMNHPGELAPLCDILNPGWGIITPIGPVHLEYFNNVEEIAHEKGEAVKAIPESGFVVLNYDDPWFEILASKASCRIVTVSLNEGSGADYIGSVIDNSLEVWDRKSENRTDFIMPLPGSYVISNALRVIACAFEFGIPAENITKAIKDYKPLNMRWKTLNINEVTFINDAYNSNPISSHAALDAFSSIPANSDKWLVFGGMNELGSFTEEAHISLGREIAYGQWKGLITVGEMGELIAQGAEREGFNKTIRCSNPQKAAKILQEQLQPGDYVLLKASRSVHLENIIENFKDY